MKTQEIIYPKRFKSLINGEIMDFHNISSAVVVKGSHYAEGELVFGLIPHTNTNTWVELLNEESELETLKQQVLELQNKVAELSEASEASKTSERNHNIKSWTPKGGEWYIELDGSVHSKPKNLYKEDELKYFGVIYSTKEQAEWASIQMRKFNRLLCYVAEHQENLHHSIIDSLNEGSSSVAIYIDTYNSVKESLNSKIKSKEVVL